MHHADNIPERQRIVKIARKSMQQSLMRNSNKSVELLKQRCEKAQDLYIKIQRKLVKVFAGLVSSHHRDLVFNSNNQTVYIECQIKMKIYYTEDKGSTFLAFPILLAFVLLIFLWAGPRISYVMPFVYTFKKEDVAKKDGKIFLVDNDRIAHMREPKTNADKKLVESLERGDTKKIYCKLSNMPRRVVHSCARTKKQALN